MLELRMGLVWGEPGRGGESGETGSGLGGAGRHVGCCVAAFERERRQGSWSPSPARPASQGHRVGPWRGQGLLEKYSLAIC